MHKAEICGGRVGGGRQAMENKDQVSGEVSVWFSSELGDDFYNSNLCLFPSSHTELFIPLLYCMYCVLLIDIHTILLCVLQALLKMDCQGLVARLVMDFVLLTTAVELAGRWRELAERLAKVSRQQMDAYEAPHRDKNGVVDSEVDYYCTDLRRMFIQVKSE